MQTDGVVDPRFATVREAFIGNFAERGELGAGVCVIHRGRVVVDLWGGWQDEARSVPWQRDTIVHTYSTTKPMVAACALVLVDRGSLELDRPVAAYWPGFAGAGKGGVTVRQLLSHQAGLVALRDSVPPDEIFDWSAIIARLEAEEPRWEPGTAHAEHAYFYGHLVGELIRRVDGRSISRFFAEEIAGPWGLDFHIGVRPADRQRVAPLHGLETLFPGGQAGEAGSVYRAALCNPPGMLLPEVVNSEAWMAAEIPAVNGYGTASAVARFYQAFLNGGELEGRRVLTAETCRAATSVQSSGHDAFLERHVDWGLGLQVEDGTFGHGGLGGSGGYADPALDLAFGYVTDLMAEHDRSDALAIAAEASVGSITAAE
ncbi:MAG TPA: serine hydrolase domain-containing protein [Candidatus Limnocylindria bacterium]